MPNIEETDRIAQDETQYYDMLYNFAQVAIKANDMALDGYSTNQIAKKLQKSAEAFYLLCKADLKENVIVHKEKIEKDEKKQEVKEPEPLPDNFIKEDNGWGLCPICRKKMVKLTSETKLVNFPAYCKACKSDYVVSWWNVENKDIAYTRYVNNKHFIDRKYIRSNAMKGTGVNSYLRTNTSATERVAMNL